MHIYCSKAMYHRVAIVLSFPGIQSLWNHCLHSSQKLLFVFSGLRHFSFNEQTEKLESKVSFDNNHKVIVTACISGGKFDKTLNFKSTIWHLHVNSFIPFNSNFLFIVVHFEWFII